MNLSQIIEALPLQVYVRRGELVIHFATAGDLVARVAKLRPLFQRHGAGYWALAALFSNAGQLTITVSGCVTCSALSSTRKRCPSRATS